MLTATKEKWVKYLTLASLILMAVHGTVTLTSVDDLPYFISGNFVLITATLMFLNSIATALKQKLSSDILNSAQVITWAVTAIAILGAFADWMGYIKLSAETGKFLRLLIGVIVSVLNVTSRVSWPSDTSKQKS